MTGKQINSQWPDWEVLVGDAEPASPVPVARLDVLHVAFEWFRPEPPILLSQVFNKFRVRRNGVDIFNGRAVVTGLVPVNGSQLCEVRLDEPGLATGLAANAPGDSAARHDAFVAQWQAWHLVPEPFKANCVNLHGYLTALKAALAAEEVLLNQRAPADRPAAEQELLQTWAARVLPAISEYHEVFEIHAAPLQGDARWPAEAIVRRLLSPLFLGAPFAHRTFYKPLGYAGDYEMMGMIMRNGFEGESLFAKLVHYWLVQQWASVSVRNRIAHLERRLYEETLRARAAGRPFRALNIGCGPAWEVQRFIRAHELADHAEFTLVDFEANAMKFVAARTAEANAATRRRAQVKTVQMSVNQLIKESLRSGSAPLGRDFDMVYCVGLFDYLPPRMCQQLTEMFFNWTIPGGLTAVANMKDDKPYRHMVEHLLDWHLIYRSAADILKFAPPGLDRGHYAVVGEELAVNLFLELRKPG